MDRSLLYIIGFVPSLVMITILTVLTIVCCVSQRRLKTEIKQMRLEAQVTPAVTIYEEIAQHSACVAYGDIEKNIAYSMN